MIFKKMAVSGAAAFACAGAFAAPGDELASFSFNCNGVVCTSFTTGVGDPGVKYDWEVSLTTTGLSFFTGVKVNGTDYAASGKTFAATGGPLSGDFSLWVYASKSGNPASPNFGGSVTLTQAVPEPETYALMLAGLGAVAFMARRRRT